MLKRLKQKGITILVSTPYMDEAALCDRIALIQDGKILEINTPQNIVANHKKNIYDVSTSDTYKLIKDLKNYPSSHSVYAFGEYIHYTDSQAGFNPNDLKDYLVQNNHNQIEIHLADTTIEDVFMDLAASNKVN